MIPVIVSKGQRKRRKTVNSLSADGRKTVCGQDANLAQIVFLACTCVRCLNSAKKVVPKNE